MNLTARILAGCLGLGTVALLLVPGFRGEYALEYGVTFVGALAAVGVWTAQSGPLRWYETMGASVGGGQGLLLLYVQSVSPSPTTVWALGFGMSTGLILGAALACIIYAFRGTKRSALSERTPSEALKTLQAKLTEAEPLTPKQEEILHSPGKLRDLLEIPPDAMEVVGAYSTALTENTRPLKPLSALPYPRTRIEEALEIALRNARDPAIRRDLNTARDALKDFIPDELIPTDPEENAKAWFIRRFGRLP